MNAKVQAVGKAIGRGALTVAQFFLAHPEILAALEQAAIAAEKK